MPNLLPPCPSPTRAPTPRLTLRPTSQAFQTRSATRPNPTCPGREQLKADLFSRLDPRLQFQRRRQHLQTVNASRSLTDHRRTPQWSFSSEDRFLQTNQPITKAPIQQLFHPTCRKVHLPNPRVQTATLQAPSVRSTPRTSKRLSTHARHPTNWPLPPFPKRTLPITTNLCNREATQPTT